VGWIYTQSREEGVETNKASKQAGVNEVKQQKRHETTMTMQNKEK